MFTAGFMMMLIGFSSGIGLAINPKKPAQSSLTKRRTALVALGTAGAILMVIDRWASGALP